MTERVTFRSTVLFSLSVIRLCLICPAEREAVKAQEPHLNIQRCKLFYFKKVKKANLFRLLISSALATGGGELVPLAATKCARSPVLHNHENKEDDTHTHTLSTQREREKGEKNSP